MQKAFSKLKLLGLSLLNLFFVLPVHASALSSLQNTGNIAYQGAPPATNLAATIAGIIVTVLGLLGVVFFLLLMYAGFLYLTAAGEEDKVKKAKNTIVSAIIGMIIILASYAIATFVEGSLTNSIGTTDTTYDFCIDGLGNTVPGTADSAGNCI